MTVDWERAWLAMKAVIVSKRSHGQRDLLAEMARIELECVDDEALRSPNGHRRKPTTRSPREVTRHG